MKPLSMRTLESAEPGGNLEVGANDEGFHIVSASGGDSVCLDEGQATGLLSVLAEALGVPTDAEDAYVRGFDRGFAEGAARAEREAWEVLRDALAPCPLRGESEPILMLPEGVTLAAAVGHVAGALAEAKRMPGQALRALREDIKRDVDAAERSFLQGMPCHCGDGYVRAIERIDALIAGSKS